MTIMKLIDKDALTAEIEKRRKEAESNCGGYKSYDEHRCDSCTVGFYNEFLEIINALEVKEVDLEKELDKYTADNFWALDGNNESPYLVEKDDMLKIAEHFYELGSHKGE